MSGRSLTSCEVFNLGSVVKQIPCNVSVVKDSSLNVCDSCFAPLEKRKRCSKCQLVYYCSRSCQCSDWKWHQQECDFLHQQNRRVPAFIRFLARCSFLCHHEKTSVTDESYNFDSLFTDVETIREEEKLEYAEMMVLVKKYLGDTIFDVHFESSHSWMKLINQVIRNTTTICTEEVDELGYGL